MSKGKARKAFPLDKQTKVRIHEGEIMKMFAKIGNIFERLNVFGAILVGAVLYLLMLSVSFAVVTRYALDWTIKGAFEFWEYSLIFVTFMGAAWVLRRGGHVSMDIAVTRFSPRFQALINGSTSILGFITCLILTAYGAWATWLDFQTGRNLVAELLIPRFPLLMIIPIGSLLLSVEFLRRTSRYFRSWKVLSGEEQPLPDQNV